MKTKKKIYSPEDQIILFRLFASWSKKKKLAHLKKMPAMDVLQYQEDWRCWARDEQLAPAGSWSTWVVKAGRGWGKTRTGAEWVIEKARAYPGCHTALVGRTASDVRKVMVLGMSGILACSPHDFVPQYNPSLRLLTWPNGATATTYSADTPDQLRGPQHSFAWCDERCFIAGTLIRTSKGLIPIEDIRPGDLVHTRGGLKRVRHAGLTNSSTTVYDMTTSDGRVLTSTGNHPIYVQDKGFKPLHSLSSGDILMVWDQLKLSTVSSGTDVDGGSTRDIIATEEESCYIGPSMRQYMGQSPREWTSTTKTKTKPIMTSQILRCLRVQNILSAIDQRDGQDGRKKKGKNQHGSNGRIRNHTLRYVSIARKNLRQRQRLLNSVTLIAEQHTDAKTHVKFYQNLANSAVSPSWNTEKECGIARLNAGIRQNGGKRKLALHAVRAFGQRHLRLSAVHGNVGLSTKIGILLQKREYASIARKLFQLNFPHQRLSFAQEHVEICTEIKENNVKVLKVEKRLENMAVFNMEVEDCHEYFANDVLVHNCSWQYDDAWDQLSFGLRISPASGVEPQCVVTTTPRNTKSMKALLSDPTTVVTHGKTYDNKENLSRRFIKEIERRYAGSRLGLQEIDGLVIDDVEGALWKRAWIDDGRVVKCPELKRVVVAVDPPASSKETNKTAEGPAECGIVVVGLGVDDHAYVLADCSTAGTPDEWSSEVLAAYTKFEADLIIGEVNNGGEMVGHTIKTAAKMAGMKNIPYKAIHASRGKQIRAEPISTIYKNQHVHHVGVLADLEFQQCNWVPGEKSPDRLDACVWGITELMLGKNAKGGMAVHKPTKEELYEEEDELW